MTRAALPWLALGLALASLAACAGECTPQVREGWVRMPPGPMASATMPMLAGYGRIDNACPTPATIVSVASPAFADASLHETRIVDGISRMRALPALRIAPRSAAVLEPGGLHLMLMQPRAPLRAGSKVAIEFRLQDGRTLRGEFELRGETAAE